MVITLVVSMETAVSAGAATTGVRGGMGLRFCAVTMATAVSAGAATVGVRGGMGLCSCAASVITLVNVAAAKSKFNTKRNYLDRRFLSQRNQFCTLDTQHCHWRSILYS